MDSSTSIPRAINAPIRLSILILSPIKSAAISAIINDVKIPIPTTKAIRIFSVKSNAIMTKISPNIMFDETRFKRFLIQMEVSV